MKATVPFVVVEGAVRTNGGSFDAGNTLARVATVASKTHPSVRLSCTSRRPARFRNLQRRADRNRAARSVRAKNFSRSILRRRAEQSRARPG